MRRRRRRSRNKRWMVTLIVLITLYAAGGFLVAPPVVRSQLTTRLAALLHREVAIDKVRLNPFACSITIEGLHVADHDGAELAGWQRAYVNFDPLVSLFRWQWQLGDVHLVEPHQRVRIAADGTINVRDLIPPATATPAGSGKEMTLPSVGVSQLLIERWSLEFIDESRRTPFHTMAGPMTLSATDFSTRAQTGSPYTFSGTTDAGTTFSWSGTIAAKPLGSTGRLESSGLSIPRHMALAEEFFDGRVASGTLTFNTDYSVTLADELEARLTNTTVAIDELNLESGANATGRVGLHRLEVTMPAADLMARTAEISRVAVDGLAVNATRRKDGSIDLMDFIPAPAAATENEERTAASGPAPSIAVAEISITSSNVAITDETNARTATLHLGGITATARNAGTDLDREIGVDAGFNVNDRGTVAVNGRVRLRPFAAQLHLDAAGIELSPFDAYVPAPADVRVLRGTIDATGQVEAEQAAGTPLAVRWSGETAINGFTVADSTRRNELASWERLAFTAVHLSLPPLDASVEEVVWDAPVIRATVTGDGRVNFLEALGRATSSTGPEAEAAVSAAAVAGVRPPFAATIGAVLINDGQIVVQDRSTAPEFNSSLRDFSGSIRGLSSDNPARAEVDLRGVLDGTGQLAVTGTINPLAEDLFTDIDVSFHDIALPRFTPYSSRYLGRTIKTGALNLDLSYHVSQNVLNGDNRVLLDQFFLGDAVPSEQALKLPIGLALAVLRDREGVIKLPPTPVTGNLDDPQFRIGPIVMHALTNVFVKAATAPFSLLGGMFGARDDQDLSYADFSAGSAELTEGAREKMPLLSKALYESPALRLTINSPAYPELDRNVLREQKFEELLREEKRLLMLAWAATEGRVETPAPAASEPITVDAAERDDLVHYAFVRRFPDRAAEMDLASQTPAEDNSPATALAESEPNVVRRILRSIFGRGDAKNAAPQPATAQSVDPKPAQPMLTAAEMSDQLHATIEIPDLAFQDLARQRATTIRDQLLAAGNVEPERITIIDPPVTPEGARIPGDTARVFFGLQ